MLNFDDLVKDPPLKTTAIALPDGREVVMHELPLSMMEDIQSTSEESDVSRVTDSIAQVAACALLGRQATDKEVRQLKGSFGTSSVMKVYYEALKFSRLSPDAVDDAKKP